MKHSKFTKVLAVLMAVALLIPGGALFASAECDHDFSDGRVFAEATCTTPRITHYYCTKCGEPEKNSEGNIIDYYGDKTLHDMIADGSADKNQYYAETTEATCENAGVIEYYCKICNDWIYDEEIAALGHNGVWIIEQEATEDHDGVAAERCTRCGEVLDTDSFSQHLHVYDDGYRTGYKRILTPATCTVDGEMGVFCAICGALFDVETIDATGHSNAQWADYMTSLNDLEDYIGCTNVVTTMPTCTKDGVITFLCDECGEVVRSYPLAKLGHNNAALEAWDYCFATDPDFGTDEDLIRYTTWNNVDYTPATCTEPGLVTFKCATCQTVMRTMTLSPLGHYSAAYEDYMASSGDPEDYVGQPNVVYKAPTCTETGSVTFRCDTCKAEITTVELDPLGHDEGVWRIDMEATADHTGWKSLHCSRCDAMLEKVEFEMHTHSFGEWYRNNDGTHTRVCSLCSFKDTANCKYNATVTAPTCLEGGYTTYVCADCGYTYVDDYTDALGHDWSEWVDDANGETHTRTCARCGETETEAHEFTDWDYNHDACLFKNGTKSRYCVACGCVETEKAQYTAWIWHLFYPIMLWVGSIVHKSVFLASLAWFLPWLNIQPKM